MTSVPRDEEDDLRDADDQARVRRSSQEAREHEVNQRIKIKLVGALWGICLLTPTFFLPAGWILWTWIVVAILITSAVVIRVYRQGRDK